MDELQRALGRGVGAPPARAKQESSDPLQQGQQNLVTSASLNCCGNWLVGFQANLADLRNVGYWPTAATLTRPVLLAMGSPVNRHFS